MDVTKIACTYHANVCRDRKVAKSFNAKCVQNCPFSTPKSWTQKQSVRQTFLCVLGATHVVTRINNNHSTDIMSSSFFQKRNVLGRIFHREVHHCYSFSDFYPSTSLRVFAKNLNRIRDGKSDTLEKMAASFEQVFP